MSSSSARSWPRPVISRLTYSNVATLPLARWSLAIVTVLATASRRSKRAPQSPGGDVDARSAKLAGRERQHDVDLAAQFVDDFHAEDVGTAGGRPVCRERPRGLQRIAHGLPHGGLESGGKARHRAPFPVDHVAGEDQHRRDAQHVRQPAIVDGQVCCQQPRLAARRAQVAVAALRQGHRIRVVVRGGGALAENQRRLAERGLPPVLGHGPACPVGDLARRSAAPARQAPRASSISPRRTATVAALMPV